jgi:hypothetical protein
LGFRACVRIAKSKALRINRLRKKLLWFVILSEAKNLSSIQSVSRQGKRRRDSSLRSE